MGRKQVASFINRKGGWHIDKAIRGRRVCESTGTSSIEEAETYLARRVEQIRQAEVYGVRPKRTFRVAATKYLNEATEVRTSDDALHLKPVMPFIGDLPFHSVHMGSPQPFMDAR